MTKTVRRSQGKRKSRINRDQILDTAIELLAKGGATEISIRKIAALIPCAPPSIYYYFENKEEILSALLERPMEDLVAQLQVNDSAASALTTYGTYWLSHPNIMSLVFLPGHWGQRAIFDLPHYQTIEQLIAKQLGSEVRATSLMNMVNGLLFKAQSSGMSLEAAQQQLSQSLEVML